VIAQVGYVGVAGLIALESMGLPLPGETALIAAAVLAQQGHLDLGLVIALAAAAAIVGDNLGYVIGRKAGRRLLERPGRLARQRRALLEHTERFFERHGPKAVFLGRWVVVLRYTAAWMAGVHRMPWKRFVLWNALGGIGWATTVGLLAYTAGEAAGGAVEAFGVAAAVLLGLVLLAALAWRRFGARGRARRLVPPAASAAKQQQ
jgi:membrane protein DedA with SNARE-associated domain